jgi:hypothetical protein
MDIKFNLKLHNRGISEKEKELEQLRQMRDHYIKTFVIGFCGHKDIVRTEGTDAVGKDVCILMCMDCGHMETGSSGLLDRSRAREVGVNDFYQFRRDIDLRLLEE